jgi:hypothetical protein
MHIIHRLFITTLILLMVSCSHQKMTIEQKQCVNQCTITQQACNKSCTNSCNDCAKDNNCTAVKAYSQYVHQQAVQCQRVARNLQSYRDPLKCRKTTCNCVADFLTCKQNCAGVIHKRLQVSPACC